MNARLARVGCIFSLVVAVSACGSSPTQPTTTTTIPTPQIVISAPTLLAPANGATTNGWPTLIVADSARTGPAAALVYRFDIAQSEAFSTILATGTVSETPGQTSYTPPSSTQVSASTALFWRVIAIDPINVVASPSSAIQSFTYTNPPSQAAIIAIQEGLVLWPNSLPPGKSGQAILGDSWNVQTVVSFQGVTHVTPTLDELRVFDVLDRGFSPQGAIDWINSNGYYTSAAWYPSAQVVGFAFEYIAFINGRWDLVFKGE